MVQLLAEYIVVVCFIIIAILSEKKEITEKVVRTTTTFLESDYTLSFYMGSLMVGFMMALAALYFFCLFLFFIKIVFNFIWNSFVAACTRMYSFYIQVNK